MHGETRHAACKGEIDLKKKKLRVRLQTRAGPVRRVWASSGRPLP